MKQIANCFFTQNGADRNYLACLGPLGSMIGERQTFSHKQPLAMIWHIGFVVFLAFSSWDVAGQTVFKFDNFSSTKGLQITGDSKEYRNKIRLTTAETWRYGGMWYKEKQVNVAEDFVCKFQFQFTQNGGSGGGADGVALVFQNYGNPKDVRALGEGMGYEGLPKSLAIEFDTFDNNEGSDNHVSIQTRGTKANSAANDASLAVNHKLQVKLKDERTHTATVTYVNELLSVYIDDLSMPVLQHKVSIAQTIGAKKGMAWIGITSATGTGYANHDIFRWMFKQGQPEIIVKKPSDPMEEENRTIVTKQYITVNSPNIRIKVWDNNRVDGDIISIKINGDYVVRKHRLSGTPSLFRYKKKLQKGDNQLVLFAHNLGTVPPNTVAIQVIDGLKRYNLTLNADLKESEALNIRLK